MQCYPMPYPPHFQGEGSSRGPVFDRLRQPVHDRLGQHQSGQGQNPGPVRPVYPDRSQQRPAPVRLVRQEYRVKEKKDESEPMQVDSEKALVRVVQVEDGKGKAQDTPKGPVIGEKSVNVSQKLMLANDHEASSSNLKNQDKGEVLSAQVVPTGVDSHSEEEVAASSSPRIEGEKGGEIEG